MKLAALQMDIAYEDRQANFDTVAGYAETATAEGADLLVLPEMFSTGFSMNPETTAEPPDGATARFLRETAQRLGIGIVGGFARRQPAQKPQNVALAVDRDGRDLALYAKTHLFSYMDEDQHHAAGDAPCPFVFDGVKTACFICYDLRFPELFRKVADDCDLVLVIASWPTPRRPHWDILLQARAVENQLYVVGVNRVGEGGGLSFSGSTVAIDPAGHVLGRLDDHPGLLYVDIDPVNVTGVRQALPFLKDRRF